MSIVKSTKLTERVSLKYSFDVYNLTNHPSFDIPIDNVSQNSLFNQLPVQGQPVLPSVSTCQSTGNSAGPFNGGYLYACPVGLGQVTKTIGSAWQVQMSLSLSF